MKKLVPFALVASAIFLALLVVSFSNIRAIVTDDFTTPPPEGYVGGIVSAPSLSGTPLYYFLDWVLKGAVLAVAALVATIVYKNLKREK